MGPEQHTRSGPPSLRDARDFDPPLPAWNEEKGGNLVLENGYARFAVERG